MSSPQTALSSLDFCRLAGWVLGDVLISRHKKKAHPAWLADGRLIG
jgi:hypothetical protein